MRYLFKLGKSNISTYNSEMKFPSMEYGGGSYFCLPSLYTQDKARKKFVLHEAGISPF